VEEQRPPENELAETAEAHKSAGNALTVNLGGSIAGGALTLWLAAAMKSWPIEAASGMLYALIAPLLLVPPLWSIVGLVFAGRILRKQSRSEMQWPVLVALAVAIGLALAALPVFAAALVRVLRF